MHSAFVGYYCHTKNGPPHWHQDFTARGREHICVDCGFAQMDVSLEALVCRGGSGKFEYRWLERCPQVLTVEE